MPRKNTTLTRGPSWDMYGDSSSLSIPQQATPVRGNGSMRERRAVPDTPLADVRDLGASTIQLLRGPITRLQLQVDALPHNCDLIEFTSSESLSSDCYSGKNKLSSHAESGSAHPDANVAPPRDRNPSRGPKTLTEVQGDQGQRKESLRCWEHGCNGRQFSTQSNLTRHLKEKAKRIPKVSCPWCGATFMRVNSRNNHMFNRSCKQIRRYSNGRLRPSTMRVLPP